MRRIYTLKYLNYDVKKNKMKIDLFLLFSV